MAKKLQLLRNTTVFDTKALAIAGLKTQLLGMAAGEPAIASYTDGEGESVLFGISLGDGKNFQIFEGVKVSEGGELEIPQEVQQAIQDAITAIKDGASDGYDTFKEIETLIKGLQTEIDTTQVGAGLGTDGTYTAKGDAIYISGATSLKSADEALDAALKAEETARTDKDTELKNEIDTLSATVTKNKVIAGDGITVNTDGANTIVSAKVKAENNALKVDTENGLYVDETALEKYQGSEAIAVSDAQDGVKTISLTIDPSDKVLSQSVTGLLTKINLTWSTSDGLKLVGKDGSAIATIPATDFIKDGMLESVDLVVLSDGTEANPQGLADGTYLHFTFNTDGGSKEIYVNVSTLSDVYTAGNGISVDGKVISAKRDDASESFLTVGADGIKLSGVQDAINAAKATIDAYTVNTKPINRNPVLNGGDIKLDGYTRSDKSNGELQIAAEDTTNTAFGKLEKAIIDNEEVCSKAFDAIATAVGLNREGLAYEAPSGTNYVSGATSVQDADAKLDAALKAVSDKLDGETAKGYLTSVVAGDGISVTAKSNNSQTISIDANAVWDCGVY